jgi:hypothetical protein
MEMLGNTMFDIQEYCRPRQNIFPPISKQDGEGESDNSRLRPVAGEVESARKMASFFEKHWRMAEKAFERWKV